MRRIVGGLLVAAVLAFAGSAAPASAAEAPKPPAMENLWPPLRVSFPLRMSLESNPLEFRCQTWGSVTFADYTWRISTSATTDGEGLLDAASVAASSGGAPIDQYGDCRANPSAERLTPGVYYWQVSRPKEPGPGVEVGPTGTFTVGPSMECEAMGPILAKAKRKVVEEEARLRAARDPKSRRRIRASLQGRKIDVLRVKDNRRFFCHGGAGGR
jgi:hypothetical protein